MICLRFLVSTKVDTPFRRRHPRLRPVIHTHHSDVAALYAHNDDDGWASYVGNAH